MNDPSLFISLLVIIGLAVIAVVVVFVIMRIERPKRAALKLLASRFEGRISFLTGVLKGKFSGFEFTVSLEPAGKNTPPRVSIHFSKDFPFHLRIYRETLLSRLGKRLGLVREVQINDPAFNSQFLIFSNRPVQAVNFLSLNAKTLLSEIFSAGFNQFVLGSRGITIQKSDYTLDDLAPERFEQVLRKILSIAGGTA